MALFGHVMHKLCNVLYVRHQGVATFAVLALMMQVLLPFGQAIAFDADTDIEYQIVCTSSGVKQIAVGADGSPIELQDALPCPFCFTHNTPALTLPDEGPNAALVLPARVQASFVRVSQRLHTNLWQSTPNPSRAPPHFA